MYCIFKYVIVCDVSFWSSFSFMLGRKPQTSKNKHGIGDWHLVVFVFTMVSVDLIILSFYTLLEGFADHFGALKVPSQEKLSSISGVILNI